MKPQYPFTTCVFDLDGTLVDSLPGISRSIDLAIAAVVPGCARKDVSALIGPPIRQVFESALCGTVSDTQLDSLEKSFREAYDSEGWRQSKPYQGVENALTALAAMEVALFVLTNKPLHVANLILAHYGLDERFQAVVGRESRLPVFSTKTQAAGFLCRRFGLVGRTTLLIGDSEDDAVAAQECGLSFAAADYGYGQVSTKLPYHPDYRLTCFSDVLTLNKRRSRPPACL